MDGIFRQLCLHLVCLKSRVYSARTMLGEQEMWDVSRLPDFRTCGASSQLGLRMNLSETDARSSRCDDTSICFI